MRETIWKKERMKFELSSPAIVAGIVLAALSFFIFLSSQKNYTSYEEVLIIPKSTMISNNLNQTIGNIEHFSQLLNPAVRIQRIRPNASILIISLSAKDQNTAELLAGKYVRRLIDMSSRYYNVKTDIDFRIISGPNTQVNINGVWWILPISLILGLLVSILIQLLSDSIESEICRRKIKLPAPAAQKDVAPFEQLYKAEEIDVPFSFDKFEDKKSEGSVPMKELEEISIRAEKSVYPNFPEMPRTSSSTASAPDNLPVADDSLFPAEQDVQPTQQTTAPIETAPHEPTEEELKARLNQLLQG